MTIRFFILQNHYRSPVDFGNEPLKAAEKGYQRLMNALEVAGKITHPGGVEGPGPKDAELEGWINRVYGELSDDFNTAKAIASISNKNLRTFWLSLQSSGTLLSCHELPSSRRSYLAHPDQL